MAKLDCSVVLHDLIPEECEFSKTNFEKVVCRDKEYRVISNFISNHIKNMTSGCMYVSGVPGTGKTHTLLKVVDMLLKKQKFKFIHINGMKIISPGHIYSIICKVVL